MTKQTGDPKYTHILRAIYSRPWAIVPETLDLIVEIVSFRASGGMLSDDEIQTRIAAAQNGPRKGGRQTGTVAVIPVYGPISQRQNLMSANSGGTSIEQLTADFRGALADASVDAIVLEVDSPGGTIDGVDELAAEIRAARGSKPILAHANTMAASAAYWLAAQADEVIVTPTGSVGSIGIFTVHQDVSKAAEMDGVKTTLVSAGKYKTEGNQWEPLSDEARANLQEQVDQVYGMFVSAVAKGRAAPVDTVRSGFGQGRIVLAKQALAQGMVDGIDTLDATIRRAARLAVAGTATAAASGARLMVVAQNEVHDTDAVINGSTTALDSGLSFAGRIELVSAQATELVEHATQRADMRAKQGRTLSATDRAGLLAAADSLRALAELPVDDSDSDAKPAATAGWRKAARNRLELAHAEYQFD